MSKALVTTQKVSDVVWKRVEMLKERQKNPEKYIPVPTPLQDLNRILHGGLPRDPFYCVVLGMDKIGKSTVGTQLFMAYCEMSGKKGVLYDLEENLWQAADRAMAMRSSTFSRTDIYTLNLTERDFEMMEQIARDIEEQQEMFVNDQAFILQTMIDDALERDCQVLGIDNYQLIQGGQGEGSVSKLESNSKTISRVRNIHGLTTFLMAQGNVKERTFGSTQPFRDGDVVLELDNIYEVIVGKKKRGNPLEGVRRVRVKRSRFSGTGELDVVFEPQYSRVRDAQTREKEPENFVEFEEDLEQLGLFQEEEETIIDGSKE
jgi:hypothetical protein